MPGVSNESCTPTNRTWRDVVPAAAGPGNGLVLTLFISSVPEDQVALRQILGPTHRVMPVDTCRQALDRLSDGDIPIVFCDRALPDGTWWDVLSQISSLPDPPLLIVTSRMADELFWAEVLNLGGFDVIATPFDSFETRHVALTATAYTRKHARYGVEFGA